MANLESSIDRVPIPDNAKTILDTGSGDVLALFTDRRDYRPVGRTRIRLNGDTEHQLEVPVAALRDIAAAIAEHANYLEQMTDRTDPPENF